MKEGQLRTIIRNLIMESVHIPDGMEVLNIVSPGTILFISMKPQVLDWVKSGRIIIKDEQILVGIDDKVAKRYLRKIIDIQKGSK